MSAERIQSLQIAVFIVLLTVLSLAETLVPLARAPTARWRHIRCNLGITVINGGLNALISGGLAAAATLAEARGFGLFEWLALPSAVAGALGFVVLDLANYVIHRLKHSVPALWRLHRVHHSDPQLDVTSSARFHPAETLLSMVFLLTIVLMFGIPCYALFAYFLALSTLAQLHHANVRWPVAADRWVRRFIVSPYMHRIHHSPEMPETNSNYADVFPFWDRLFRTYRDRNDYDGLGMGLDDFWSDGYSVWSLLGNPFVKAPTRTPSP